MTDLIQDISASPPQPTPQQAHDDIKAIRRFLTAMFPGTSYVIGEKAITHHGEIEPDRFNRTTLTIDGRVYMVSVFQPAVPDLSTPTDKPVTPSALGEWQDLNWYEDEEFKQAWEAMKGRGFQWSSNNIEKAHLGWLMHKHSDRPALPEPQLDTSEAEVPTHTITALTFDIDFRQSNPKLHQLYVGHAREAIRITREFCETLWERSRWPDSAIASAAWRAVAEHAKEDAAWFEASALEFLHQEEYPLPRVVASVENLEPGEYVGHIEDRDGQLTFVIDTPETPVD